MDAPDASPRTATDASPRIAYLGPAGTFTEQATRQWDPDATHEAWPAPSVPAAVGALRSGEVSAAVVPFENSVDGDMAKLSLVVDHAIRCEILISSNMLGLVLAGCRRDVSP